jgi:hypothetical protein
MVTETLGDAADLVEESMFLRAIDPQLVVPIVVYLASRSCGLTHHNFSACAGRFARAFVGLADGWLAEEGSVPAAEDIGAHIDAICAVEPYTVPSSIFDEIAALCERRGISV